MTMTELNKIFINSGVWEYDYCIGDKIKPLSEVAYCLKKEKNKYHFFVKERNYILEEKFFKYEDEACVYFLNQFAKDDKKLREYIAVNYKGV